MRLNCLTLTFIFCLGLISCKNSPPKSKEKETVAVQDLPQILEKGELTVVTMYSSVDYFKYRWQNMGIQYDLSQQFANSLGLSLNVLTANTESELLEILASGKADLIAYNLPVTKELKDSISYCGAETDRKSVV